MNKIVTRLKKAEEYHDKCAIKEDDFINAIEKYFYDKYGIGVTVYVWGKTFGFEKDLNVYGVWATNKDSEYAKKTRNFTITIDVLYKFCKDFDSEFLYTTCDGERYVFSFKNINIKKAFW